MKRKAQQLREKFKRGELVIGGHSFFTDPAITNLLGYHGFEFVWIDGEHGAFTPAIILQHLMAAGDADTASLVRIAWNDPVLAKPILDMGPDGIIFPYVRTPEEARMAVETCIYPLKGTRGFGPRRAQKYGAYDPDEYLADNDASVLKILQIEHVDAINALEEIVQVEGIDLIVIGPNDLSASYGLLGKTKDPQMKKVYDYIAEVCKKYNMPFGVSVGCTDYESMQDWIARGAVFLGCGDDMGYMSEGCKNTLKIVNEMKKQ